MHECHIVTVQGVEIELHVDSSLIPSTLRAFMGTTPRDAEIDDLPVPTGPFWLRASVLLLRWYRARVSPLIGQRCVFEPSCSRYSEVAFRQYGFAKGLKVSVGRLRRCRPGAGGADIP